MNLQGLIIVLSSICFVQCSFHHEEVKPINQCVTDSEDLSVFQLTGNSTPCLIEYDTLEFDGVKRVTDWFINDIGQILGKKPLKSTRITKGNLPLVIVGTLGKSRLIDSLVKVGKIDINLLQNKWETSLIQVIEHPCKGLDKALVIAGSDKRGTIYGMLSLSRAMGVSPWYWWADVPVKKHDTLFIKPGIYSDGEPKVKYRGIFINDEAPALSEWVYEKFGEFNSRFYIHVFELMLRLKGNYLWPAMWGRAFNVNDTLNPVLADELGIVMGTSHHEPMMRSQKEWHLYGNGAWNYNYNDAVLDQFWTDGIKNMGKHESIVTIGMRGDGDEPMSDENNIALLEAIVKKQRAIIEKETGKPAQLQPQIWALYKEVLDYYHKGMRVPDDVTLLLCDDNWGNVRFLPNEKERAHRGGYGMYYHFDYVGGPRNYKWLNTNSIPRIWEQMHLAYSYGVDRIWIVNVGDIKPMELPMSFFLDYAWNPDEMPLEKMTDYTRNWAAEQFGNKHAQEIAWLLDKYTWYNSRRKPELLDENSYSLYYYREFEKIVSQYNGLETQCESVSNSLSSQQQDAYYQLVKFPIKASANLNELYYTVALNHLYYQQRRIFTNQMERKARELFISDSLLTYQYNHVLAGGKWNHQMDQTHIGYTHWQQPDFNKMPLTFSYNAPDSALMGIWIEGDTTWWPKKNANPELPVFDKNGQGNYFIEVFNCGRKPYNVQFIPSEPWIVLSNKNKMEIIYQQRIEVSIDWKNVPIDAQSGKIIVEGSEGQHTIINIKVYQPQIEFMQGAIMTNGCISINAHNFSDANTNKAIEWRVIQRVGKIASGITAFPLKSFDTLNLDDNPRLDYMVTINDTGLIKVHLLHCPTLDFKNQGGLKYALSIDDQKPVVINLHQQATTKNWEKWVGDNIIETVTQFKIQKPGIHILHYFLVDDGLVLQKILIDQGGLKPSYLGPWGNYTFK